MAADIEGAAAPKPSDALKGLTKDEVLRVFDSIVAEVYPWQDRYMGRALRWAVYECHVAREERAWAAYAAANKKKGEAHEAFMRRASRKLQDDWTAARMEADRCWRAYQLANGARERLGTAIAAAVARVATPIEGVTMATAPDRRKLIAAVQIARKDMALDEGTYRALLRRVAGVDSAREASDAQLQATLNEFERLGWKGSGKRSGGRGDRAQARHPQAGKARALWLSLWQLGAIADPSEAALAAFGQRVTLRAALQWYGAADYNKLIEGLKARCRRAGYVAQDDPAETRRELLRAQWRLLAVLGEVRAPADDVLLNRLDGYISAIVGRTTGILVEDSPTLDRCIDALGRKIRKAQANSKAAPPAEAEAP